MKTKLVLALVIVVVVAGIAPGVMAGQPAPNLPPSCNVAGVVDQPDSRFIVANDNPGVYICAVEYNNGAPHLFVPPLVGDGTMRLEWFGDQFVIVDTGGAEVTVAFYRAYRHNVFIPMAANSAQ